MQLFKLLSLASALAGVTSAAPVQQEQHSARAELASRDTVTLTNGINIVWGFIGANGQAYQPGKPNALVVKVVGVALTTWVGVYNSFSSSGWYEAAGTNIASSIQQVVAAGAGDTLSKALIAEAELSGSVFSSLVSNPTDAAYSIAANFLIGGDSEDGITADIASWIGGAASPFILQVFQAALAIPNVPLNTVHATNIADLHLPGFSRKAKRDDPSQLCINPQGLSGFYDASKAPGLPDSDFGISCAN